MESCPLLRVERSPAEDYARSMPARHVPRPRVALFLALAALVGGIVLLSAAARRPSVVAEYDAAAATYDTRWAAYLNTSVAYALERLQPDIEALTCGERCTVLDVGCGTGALASALAKEHPTWNVICADSCKLMLMQARLKGLSTTYAYAEHLPLADATVHLVVSASSFHFWHDRAAALREARRVLAPGGRIFLLDWAGDYLAVRLLGAYLHLAGYPREDGDVLTLARAEALVRSAGFELARVAGRESFRHLRGVRMRVLGLPVGPSWVVMSLTGVARAQPEPPGPAAQAAHPAPTPAAPEPTSRANAPEARRGALRVTSLDALAHAVATSGEPWLVEFFDPRCGACRAFSPVWKELLATGVQPPGSAHAVRFATVDVSTAGGMDAARHLGALEHGVPHVQLFLPSSTATHVVALKPGITVPLTPDPGSEGSTPGTQSQTAAAAVAGNAGALDAMKLDATADDEVEDPGMAGVTARALRARVLRLLAHAYAHAEALQVPDALDLA